MQRALVIGMRFPACFPVMLWIVPIFRRERLSFPVLPKSNIPGPPPTNVLARLLQTSWPVSYKRPARQLLETWSKIDDAPDSSRRFHFVIIVGWTLCSEANSLDVFGPRIAGNGTCRRSSCYPTIEVRPATAPRTGTPRFFQPAPKGRRFFPNPALQLHELRTTKRSPVRRSEKDQQRAVRPHERLQGPSSAALIRQAEVGNSLTDLREVHLYSLLYGLAVRGGPRYQHREKQCQSQTVLVEYTHRFYR